MKSQTNCTKKDPQGTIPRAFAFSFGDQSLNASATRVGPQWGNNKNNNSDRRCTPAWAGSFFAIGNSYTDNHSVASPQGQATQSIPWQDTRFPGRNGLQPGTEADYRNCPKYFGAWIGRCPQSPTCSGKRRLLSKLQITNESTPATEAGMQAQLARHPGRLRGSSRVESTSPAHENRYRTPSQIPRSLALLDPADCHQLN